MNEPSSSSSSSSSSSVDALLSDAARLIAVDEPCHAVEQLRHARTVARDARDVDVDPRAAVVREVEAEIAALLHEISDADAWKLHGTSMGTSVLLRTTNTYDNLLRFRSEKLMDVSIFSLLAAVNEHEDYEKFMPGLDTVELLASPSKFRRTLRLSGKKPWPLNRTEMILEAYGGKVKVTPIPTHV